MKKLGNININFNFKLKLNLILLKKLINFIYKIIINFI